VRCNRRAKLLGVALLVGAAFLAGVGPAEGSKQATIHFTFTGYANNVRVRPPLVGAFQLGVSKIHGSGTLGPGTVLGSYVDTDDPLYSRYPFSWLRAKIVGYSFYQAPHAKFTKITATVEITSSSRPKLECEPGMRATLTVYDSNDELSNGKPSDYVTVGRWKGGQTEGAKCGHVHGWTNEDGGGRTSPSYGGPPDGGQRAIVKVTVS
jgi:hypothetical protein